MKKQSALVVTVVLCVGLGLVVVASHGMRGALIVKQADAAFRDGAYQAKIDVDRGRKAHVSSGMLEHGPGPRVVHSRLRRGLQGSYGSEIGKDRSFSRRNLRVIATGCPMELVIAGHRSRFVRQDRKLPASGERRRLRDAYSNGYQEGYYVPQESAELKTISQN